MPEQIPFFEPLDLGGLGTGAGFAERMMGQVQDWMNAFEIPKPIGDMCDPGISRNLARADHRHSGKEIFDTYFGEDGEFEIDSSNIVGTEWDDLTDAGDTILHKHDIYAEIAAAETITGLWTFSRGAATPFAVAANAIMVANLDADKLDGYHGVELAALAENEAITGNWDFQDYLTVSQGWIKVGVNDTARGRISLYGDGAASIAGGKVSFFLAADYDSANIDQWVAEVAENDFKIWSYGTGLSVAWMTFQFDAGAIRLGQGGGVPNIVDLDMGNADIIDVNDITIGSGNFIGISNADERIVFDAGGQIDILGANLDLNANEITGCGNITMSGTATVDGVDVSTISATYMPLAGGTFTSDVTWQTTSKAIFGDAAQYIHRSVASVLSYVTDGRHEFTGGPVYVGTGTPGHLAGASGELFVAGVSEFNGVAYFDSQVQHQSTTLFYNTTQIYGAVFIWRDSASQIYASLDTKADDGAHLCVGDGNNYGNRNLIITSYSNRTKDHDHDTLSPNPTLFIHSIGNPDDDNTQWWSIAHLQTHALYSVGVGWHEFGQDVVIADGQSLFVDNIYSATASPSDGVNVDGTTFQDGDITTGGDITFGTATDSLKWSANEYITSGAAGYLDAHFVDDDKGMRFYSGANLLLKARQYNDANPTFLRFETPVRGYFYVGGTRTAYFSSTAWVFYKTFKMFADNLAMTWGAGTDASAYYDGTDLIIDPDVAGTGKVYIGATADDDICAAKIGLGNTDPQAPLDVTGDGLISGALYIDTIYSYSSSPGDIINIASGVTIGDGGVTDYADFSDGDLTFVGTAGLPYAGLSVTDNAGATTVGVAGTYVQFLGFDTNSPSNNCTPDHTNDHITIVKAGVYTVVASFCISSVGAGAADHISFQLKKNGGTADLPGTKVQRKLAGGGDDIGSISMSGLIDVAEDDTIEVWLTDEDNADDILVADANLAIFQVGGT